MKITSLLILWTLPLLHAGEYGPRLSGDHNSRTPHLSRHARSSRPRIGRPYFAPDTPNTGRLSAFLLDEEEDSVEDGSVDGGLPVCRSGLDLTPGNGASLLSATPGRIRNTSCPHPLRC